MFEEQVRAQLLFGGVLLATLVAAKLKRTIQVAGDDNEIYDTTFLVSMQSLELYV